MSTVAEPRPASSVLLVRAAPAGAPEPLEVYMIRRQQQMRFLGGYYAFPGGRVDAADAAADVLRRSVGLGEDDAERLFPGEHGLPALAWWITAVRELLEETGLLLTCDEAGGPVAAAAGAVARAREALVHQKAMFADILTAEGWWCDLRPLRYLSHFITPRSSPIRFTARFFLCPVPPGQEPHLFTEETSEGFWIHPGEGYRRFRAGEMPMAEPAEYGLAYLAQFDGLDGVWAAHADGRHKFHGIVDRIEFWGDFDWAASRWKTPRPPAS